MSDQLRIDPIPYWGHRVLVRRQDGSRLEGVLGQSEDGSLLLDDAPLNVSGVEELRAVGVCFGPPDEEDLCLFRGVGPARGSYRVPCDQGELASRRDALRYGEFLLESDVRLVPVERDGRRALEAADVRVRAVRRLFYRPLLENDVFLYRTAEGLFPARLLPGEPLRLQRPDGSVIEPAEEDILDVTACPAAGDTVVCVTADGTTAEGTVISAGALSFYLDTGKGLRQVRCDSLRQLRFRGIWSGGGFDGRFALTPADADRPGIRAGLASFTVGVNARGLVARDVESADGGRKLLGLMLFSRSGKCFIGENIEKVSGSWRVTNPIAAYRARGEFPYDPDCVYAVRYTPGAGTDGDSDLPPVEEIVPVTGKAGLPLSFPKSRFSDVWITAEKRPVAPGDKLHYLFRDGERTIVGRRDRYEYDPRFMVGELTGKPVFASVVGEDSPVCGRLSAVNVRDDGIWVDVLYDMEKRFLPFSDITELRAFGHFTALDDKGGTIDGRFPFRMDDLHSQRDRDSSLLKLNAAASFRLVRPAAGRGFMLDDVMCMEESSELRYAVADDRETVFHFGVDPCVLTGPLDSRKVCLPWEAGAVYTVSAFRAAASDYPEVTWLDSYARFELTANSSLVVYPLETPEDGYVYGIVKRNSASSLTVYRSVLYHGEKLPQSLLGDVARSDSNAFNLNKADLLGQVRGNEAVCSRFFSAKRATQQSHRFLIRYLPDADGGITPDTVEVLHSFRLPLLAAIRTREGGAPVLVLGLDRSVQTRSALLEQAFRSARLNVLGREAAAFERLSADNINRAREYLDGLDPAELKRARLTAAARLRFMIWDKTDSRKDRDALRAVLPQALVALGRDMEVDRASLRQEQARFLYMLALRIEPWSLLAMTRYIISLACQQDPRMPAALSNRYKLGDVTAVIAGGVDDETFDAMVAGMVLLFVPMNFQISKQPDKLRDLTDPEGAAKTMTVLLANVDRAFAERLRQRLEDLVEDPVEGTTEDLLRQAVDQCEIYREFFTRDYAAAQYDEELQSRLDDPRSRLLFSGRNEALSQFRALLTAMHDTSEYNIFTIRKARFKQAAEKWRKLHLCQSTCLYQYLFPTLAISTGYRLSRAMAKFNSDTRPVLEIRGCDVIGQQGDLLHLRVSVGDPGGGPLRQTAENVSLRVQRSDRYEILEFPDRESTPSTERVSIDTGNSELVRFVLNRFPAGRTELGIDFCIRPVDPAAGQWTLKASLGYTWPWELPQVNNAMRLPEQEPESGAAVTDETELTFSAPGEIAPLDKTRVGLFHARFDGMIARYIRRLAKSDPDDPQIPALRNILDNRRRDVEHIVDAFCDPAFPDQLTEEARLVILQGQWRVGKSTVLNRVAPRLLQIDPEAVILTMELPSVNRQDEKLCTFSRVFSDAFLRSCRKAGVELGLDNETEAVEFAACRRALSVWMGQHPGKRVVLLMDEFTHLYADMRAGLASRNDLKELVSFLIGQEWRLLTVAVGGEFTARMLELLDGNTVQKMPRILDLQYLERAQVADFARFVIGEDRFPAGSAAAEAALDRLYELTRGNMFLLQGFCADLVNTAETDAANRAAAGDDAREDLVFTNRWIDRTIRRVASGMTELEKKMRFDFLWNPFNEDETGGEASEMTAPESVKLLDNERVFEDYRRIFRKIIDIADGTTHTFQREALRYALTEGETPEMDETVFNERFRALAENRHVLEHVNHSELCYRISVDLCFCLLYLSD